MELPADLFVFNPDNRGYINGKSPYLANKVTFSKVLRFALILLVFVLIPLAAVFYLLFSLLLKDQALTYTIIVVVGMLIAIGYVAFLGYRNGRRLEKEGKLVLGKVVKYDTRLAADTKGYKSGTRIHYMFTTSNGDELVGSKIISSSSTHLKDGRELPQPGTPIAILHLDSKWHTPL